MYIALTSLHCSAFQNNHTVSNSSHNNGNNQQLKRTLKPLTLWGLGVGYVISGMYFGWNLGLPEGGTLGLAIATFFIIIMYLAFTFSYTELACAIPKAGGAFDYATRALGKHWGFIGGMAQNIEFIVAPAAIALAIGDYFQSYMPSMPILATALIVYIIFTALNIYGVQAAATFELFITIIAVIGLLIFAGVALPEFEWANLKTNALPNGYGGVFAAIPFAIWFFLAIEGVANVAEETINPQRNIVIGFGSAILTLVVLCLLTFCASIGVDGWETIVYSPEQISAGITPETETSDSPLPLALAAIIGEQNFIFPLIVGIGLLGLIASFHGIILAAGRATFEFGRVGYAPKALGNVHKRFRTPSNALLINMVIGIIIIVAAQTADIITLAALGALTLYIISMISLFVLRRREPKLDRPFRVMFYPVFPALALIIASIALIALIFSEGQLALIYFGILFVAYLWFYLTV